MRRVSIRFFAIAILLTILALVESGLATDYYKSYEEQEHLHPPPPPKTTIESPPPTPNPNKCRETGQVCRTNGPFSCCKDLWCVVDVNKNFPGNIGTCLPLNPPPEKCQNMNQLCQIYGPYTCCEGLHCTHPSTLPQVAGLNPDKMKLPPGIGLCTTI